MVVACMLVLIFGFAVSAQAATHTVYENGNISSTYLTYFKDILPGVPFSHNYVAFRSGQYSYTMVTGDIEYNESTRTFTLQGEGHVYVFEQTSNNYNSYYTYDDGSISNFSVQANDSVLYSDVGSYPQLMERGAKYEMLTAVLICIALLGYVVSRFFRSR